jgi:6-phosphogluconolactonase/glucosamine-6-phosphate isomerase/deaminase
MPIQTTITNLKKVVHGNCPARVEEYAAKSLFEEIIARRDKRQILIGCSGSPALAGIYKALMEIFPTFGNDLLAKVQFFLLEERLMTPDEFMATEPHAPLSSRIVVDGFIKFLVEGGYIKKKQYHSYGAVGWADDEHERQAAQEYHEAMVDHGEWFDIVILDAGADGRCAGLLPNHPSTLNDDSRGFTVHCDEELSMKWMTASPNLLADSELGLILFNGQPQEDVLSRFVQGDETRDQLPCAIVKEMESCIVATPIRSEATNLIS